MTTPEPKPTPEILVRIAQHTRTPCPGKPYHDCKDRHHPIAVQVISVKQGADPMAVPLLNGADFVTVTVP